MTALDILNLLREDFKGVELSVNDLSVEIASMKTTLSAVEKTLDKHDSDIKTFREAQLTCIALNGWPHVNLELENIRAAGNQAQANNPDPPPVDNSPPPIRYEKRASVLPVLVLLKTLAPWLMTIIALVFGVGVLVGNGGDSEKTKQTLDTYLQAIHDISLRVKQIETSNIETIQVASPMECDMGDVTQ